MVIVKNKKIKSKEKSSYQDLYISMYDAQDKRKNLLGAMKNSLIMQEEFERISEIRKNKTIVLDEIKKSLNNINKKYQSLKKLIPNVKNIISYTEKEIIELEKQVVTLENSNDATKSNITLDKHTITSLKDNKPIKRSHKNRKNETNKKEFILSNESIPEQKKAIEKHIDVTSTKQNKFSKLDRIKNNLKVIEGKLNNI